MQSLPDATLGVNPNAPGTPAPAAFVQLPQTLIFDARLSAVDLRVACVLLTYTRPGKPEAWPSQDKVAEAIGLSVDTVQRALKSLQASGYLLVRRLRDRLGRLGKNVYNLAAVAGLVPAKKAVPAHTAPVQSGETPAKRKPRPSIPHPCGVLKKNNSLNTEEQQQVAPPESKAEPIPHPLVVALLEIDVKKPVAERLVRDDPQEVEKQLRYLPMRRVTDKAAALVASVLNGWGKPAQAQQVPSGAAYRAQSGQTGASAAASEEWERARARHLGGVPEAEFAQLKARAEKHLRGTCRLAHFSQDTLAQKMAQAWRFQCEGKVRA